MASDMTFASLLREGIATVAARQHLSKHEVEARIADALGYSVHQVQTWQRRQVPTHPDQVAFLASYCMRYGRLECDWARRLLEHGKHPDPGSILKECCGPVPSEPPTPPIINNLPSRDEEFIGREMELADTREGISRWPICVIDGMAGIGKTALAKEVAFWYVTNAVRGLITSFKAIVWISFEPPQQKKGLNDVIDTIARELGHYYIAQMRPERTAAELIKKLQAFPTLIIIDNFDSINDPDLLTWLQRLPEGTRVLAASRSVIRRAWDVTLRGLSEEHALELIRRHVRRRKLPSTLLSGASRRELVKITNGNPKAIELALGHVSSDLSLSQVVEQLHKAQKKARQTTDHIIDELFTSAWKRISDEARNVWLTMPLFAGAVSREAIGQAAELTHFQRDMALDELVDMFLLDLKPSDTSNLTCFTLHPLAREYAHGQLEKRPAWSKRARRRLANWYIEFARSHGGKDWANSADFQMLAVERENIMEIGRWLYEQGDLEGLWNLAEACWEMLNVTGYWHDREELLNTVLQLSRRRGNELYEAWSLAELAWTELLTYRLAEARSVLEEARMIAGRHDAKYLLAVIRGNQSYLEEFEGNYDEAMLRNKEEVELLQSSDIDERERGRRLAESYYQQGRIASLMSNLDGGNLDVARRFFEQARDLGERHGFERVVAYSLNWLADLALLQNQVSEARTLLDRAWTLIKPWNDSRRMAHLRFTEAKLAAILGDLESARRVGNDALQEFQNLGMSTEEATAREWLDNLDRLQT